MLGSWGSGKSSVIEYIAKDKGICEVIVYDAWENEGFPFELGFLNHIVSELETKEILAKDVFKEQLDALQKVKEEKHMHSLFNVHNAFIALALLLLSLAIEVLKQNEFNLFGDIVLKVWGLNISAANILAG